MKEGTYKTIWISVQVTLLILPILLMAWYTPYMISHDQHMVNTVNERALNYDSGNGTITDFTEAEIKSNDAMLEYEERVWMLQNQELYWIYSLVLGLLVGLMCQLGNFFWSQDYYYRFVDDDDFDDEEEFNFDNEDEFFPTDEILEEENL